MSNEQNEKKPIPKGDGASIIVGLIAVVLAVLVSLTILFFGAVGQFERHKKMLAYHKDIPAQTQMAADNGAAAAFDENIA